jgi:hypothetical protein
MDTFFANRGAYVVLAFAAVAFPVAAAVVAYFWYKLRREEMVTALKLELAERGLAPEEICAVIKASPAGTTGVAEDLAALNGRVVNVQSRQPSQASLDDHLPLEETADFKGS